MISQGLVYMPSLTDALRSLMDPKNKNHKVCIVRLLLEHGLRCSPSTRLLSHPCTVLNQDPIRARTLCFLPSHTAALPNTLRDT